MKGSKRGSPVRIFTNINPADVILPSAEGYRYRNVMINASMLVNNVLQLTLTIILYKTYEESLHRKSTLDV